MGTLTQHRQIKFRAWNLVKKVMEQVGDIEWCDYDTKEIESICTKTAKIKPPNFILMQFTGLLDKNGKEIYEDDICHVNDGFIGKKRVIVWDDNGYGWAYKIMDNIENAAGKNIQNSIKSFKYRRVNDLEIIGNIYETL